ncbi:MAG: SHOCT domain-containing protein [Acidimicrobiia bacterium]|nr:SHOCT domain-containing protein [Acidimicrobiia bacterium]
MLLGEVDYSLGDALLTVLWIFGFVIFFWLLITIFSDLFRDHEESGWAKAAWVIFIIILPFLGILVYVIARGKGMAERNMKAAAEAQQQFDQYVRQAAGTPGESTADQLQKLSDLHDAGKLTDDEFATQKARLLG